MEKRTLYLGTIISEIGRLYPGVNIPQDRSIELGSEQKAVIDYASQLSVGMEKVAPNGTPGLLPTIFSEIDGKLEQEQRYFLPGKLSLNGKKLTDGEPMPSDYFFPQATSDQADRTKIEAQITSFLIVVDFNASVGTVYAQAEKYLSKVSANIEEAKGVSLYDYLKATASIAVCLSDFMQENNLSLDEVKELDCFTLIGGDTSGIQDYIYDVISKNASKNLKGRSLYLQLVIESAIVRLLNRLGLERVNVVYASGGGFFIIAPNVLSETDQQLLVKELQEGLWEEFKTRLFMAIDFYMFKPDGLMNNKLVDIWDGLLQNMAIQKQQKFKVNLIGDFDELFEPIEQGGLAERDSISNEEITTAEKNAVVYLDVDDDGNNILPITARTNNLLKLGKVLRNAERWIISREPIPVLESKGIEAFNPCKFNVFHYFIPGAGKENDKGVWEQVLNEINACTFKVEVNVFNDSSQIEQEQKEQIGQLDFFEDRLNNPLISQGFTFYGGNEFPTVEDEDLGEGENKYLLGTIKSINQLVIDQENNNSFNRVGMLRMDVDNLGQMFRDGLKDEHLKDRGVSLSRYSCLSRNLDLFFKGYLNKIVNQVDKERAYILYSGGDDLFLIGKWDVLLKIAIQIRKDFKRFVAGNTKVTLSGGLKVLPPKFQVMLGSEYAAAAEKQAKNHEYKLGDGRVSKKDSFTLFGKPLHWDSQFEMVEELKEELIKLVQNNKVDNSLLRKIISYSEMQIEQRKSNSNPKWMWMSTYDLARVQDSLKSSDARRFVKKIMLAIPSNQYGNKKITNTNQYTFLNLLSIAARWANLEQRSNYE